MIIAILKIWIVVTLIQMFIDETKEIRQIDKKIRARRIKNG